MFFSKNHGEINRITAEFVIFDVGNRRRVIDKNNSYRSVFSFEVRITGFNRFIRSDPLFLQRIKFTVCLEFFHGFIKLCP